MSGLEPLTALGLACNIMQLLSFGREAISLYRKIDHEGNYDPSLETYSEKAANISEGLKKHLGRTGLNLAPEDAKLEQSAKDCKDAADELSTLLQSLSMNGQSSRRKKLKAVGKTIWKKSDITQLENNLNNIKSNLDTQLLVEIFDRLNQESLKNDIIAAVKKLFDDTLNQVSTSQGVTQQHFEALKEAQKCFHQQHQQSFKMMEQHVAANALHLEDDKRRRQEENDDLARQRLLGSLRFDSMNQRKNDIYEAYNDTCLWIFGQDHGVSDDANQDADSSYSTDSDSANYYPLRYRFDYPQRTWPSFVDWLESDDQPIYWICGKPGSGKSTLTKFIASGESPTIECLKEWRKNVQILSHFFWLAGSEMQHNLKGFLCSLIHQILSQDKPAASDYLRSDTRGGPKLHNTDWSPGELQSLLFKLTRRDGKAYFIVVDGLDEVSPTNTQNTLIQLIRKLQNTRVKFCLSSRSEGVLKTLERYPTLHMHKFIEADIKKYTQETLGEANPGGYSPKALERFTETIVANADGVFLWVYLVVNSLVEGFYNGDSVATLAGRLEDTPTDLTDLYIKMLKRRKGDPKSYKKGLSQVINTMLLATDFGQGRSDGGRRLQCLTHDRISVFELMATIDEQFLEQYLNKDDHIPPEHLQRLCSDMERSIEAWSSGLLKVAVEERQNSRWAVKRQHLLNPESYGEHISFANKTVKFIHRTARDFLFNEQEGLDLWTSTSASQHGLYQKLVKACIMRCQIWNFKYQYNLHEFLLSIYEARRSIVPESESILRAIDKAHTRGVLRMMISVEAKELGFLNEAGKFGFSNYAVKRVDEMRHAHRFSEQFRLWLMFEQCGNIPVDTNRDVDTWLGRERLIQHCAGLGKRIPPTDQLYPEPGFSTNPLLNYLVSTLQLLHRVAFFHGTIHPYMSEQIVQTLKMLQQDLGSIYHHSQALVQLTFTWDPDPWVYDSHHFFDHYGIMSEGNDAESSGEYLVLIANAPYIAAAIFDLLQGDNLVSEFGIQTDLFHAEALLLTISRHQPPSRNNDIIHYEIDEKDSKSIINFVSPLLLEKKTLKLDLDEQTRKLGRFLQGIMARSSPLSVGSRYGISSPLADRILAEKCTSLVPPSLARPSQGDELDGAS